MRTAFTTLFVLCLAAACASAEEARDPAFVCCVEDSCFVITLADCDAMGGAWHEGYDSCENNPCYSYGVCCFEDGSHVHLDMFECLAMGGLWLGDVPCDPNPCPQACCIEADCLFITPEDCVIAGGVLYGGLCEPNPCTGSGVCCLGWDHVHVTMEECEELGGLWLGDVPCEPNPCPGACCVMEYCLFIPWIICMESDGVPLEPWTDECEPNPCDPTPADKASWGAIKKLYQ